MATFTGRYWLNFSGPTATEPLVYSMGKAFDVVFNIRQATIHATGGIMAIELTGERQTVKEAIAWLEAKGVAVEPVEINTIEG
ncbi:MAG: NIL domain-containing protein [Verrucomicrobiia bacterium]